MTDNADIHGPMKICCSCGEPKHCEAHAGEGWVCKKCLLDANTVVTTYWIRGRRFHFCLKPSQKKETPTGSVVGAASHFTKKGD